MVTCPKCQQSLPDWAQKCHVCGTDVALVPRGLTGGERKLSYYQPAKWVVVAYNIIAGYFILSGLAGIAQTLIGSQQKIDGVAVGLGPVSYVSMAFSALTALVGLGLIARVELARGVVNVICGFRILFGLLGLAGSLFGALLFGPLGILFMFLNVLDIVTAGLMIYLLGETDRAPNI